MLAALAIAIGIAVVSLAVNVIQYLTVAELRLDKEYESAIAHRKKLNDQIQEAHSRHVIDRSDNVSHINKAGRK